MIAPRNGSDWSYRGIDPDVLRTGDFAKLGNFSSRTAQKILDSGEVRGAFRVPGTSHRRIMKGDAVKYLREQGVPVKLQELLLTGNTNRSSNAIDVAHSYFDVAFMFAAGKLDTIYVASDIPNTVIADLRDRLQKACERNEELSMPRIAREVGHK